MEQKPDFSLTMELCGRPFVFTYGNTFLIEYQDYPECNHIWHKDEKTTVIFDSGNERELLQSYGWEPIEFNKPSEVVRKAFNEFVVANAHEELDAEIEAFYHG